MIAEKTVFEPHSSELLPNSAKVYAPGKIHPELRVPFREITLSPTHGANERVEPNPAVRLYDCSGPWGDSTFNGSVEQGLPPLRLAWILARGDVDEVATPRRHTAMGSGSTLRIPTSASRGVLRAKPGKIVTQLQYAREGSITPEMEFIAIRENLA